MHSADFVVKAVKNGWMPFYPQYGESNFDIVKEAQAAGKSTEETMRAHIVDRLKTKDLEYSVTDPDKEINFPRVWFIWRWNALMSSAKGHEYMLKHYLGKHHNDVAKESAKGEVKEINWFDLAPQGKMDLVVDINFRMDTSALYSDIVLPRRAGTRNPISTARICIPAPSRGGHTAGLETKATGTYSAP